ncbi:unnamed protein product [Vicia faba]|uniref:Uncharacterized protein n=1 Tax=Vicia faba TaxID=3906 RepID=A0AAV1A6I1_VICFA|nr:unnamed protein product [Vicia faba]
MTADSRKVRTSSSQLCLTAFISNLIQFRKRSTRNPEDVDEDAIKIEGKCCCFDADSSMKDMKNDEEEGERRRESFREFSVEFSGYPSQTVEEFYQVIA